ncbi:MAG: radical SAM protein [Candidatus Buchananbacteria bacterium]
MKILLINPPIDNIIESDMPKQLESGLDFLPPLGLMYIASYVNQKTTHQIKILDCPVEKITYTDLNQKINQEKPTIVGLTAMTFTLIDVIKVAQLVKKINPQIKVVLGGPHVNIYPAETLANPEIDFLVLGEGEQAFVDLLENINDLNKLKQIRGLVFKEDSQIINTGQRELITDLDQLPFPARNLTPYQKYFSIIAKKNPTTTMFTSRGCPYQCLFCDRPHLGKIFRARSAKNVVAELLEIEKMGIKEIFIYDDTFTIDRQRVIDVCNLIIQQGLKINWDIRARVNTVDEELLKLMKQAGCERIHYGVEAGTEKVLKTLRKGITLDQIKQAFALTKKVGIETAAYFMLGSPGETLTDIKQSIKLAKNLFPDYVHFSVTTPFPATELYFKGLREGVIKKDYWQEFSIKPQPNFQPPAWEENFTRQELFAILLKAYQSYYLSPRYILKRIKEIKSWDNLKNNFKAGLKLMTLIIKK